jgi:Fur family ferric uptake transcriptional regulator
MENDSKLYLGKTSNTKLNHATIMSQEQDNNQNKTNVKQIFTEYLKAHALRKTPERFAILDKVYSIEGHFDIEQLYKYMIEAKYPVSRATLYNNIAILLDANLLIRHHINNMAQYEKTQNNGVHNHLICTMCGKVKEFTNQNIIRAIRSKKITNFSPSHYSLYIYGLCSKCARKQAEEIKAINLGKHKD